MGDLSALFHDEAVAPLRQASLLIRGEQLEEALTAVGREPLMRHLRQGVERVARGCGRPSLEVFRRLPMEELESHLEKLASDQKEALEQWRRHAQAGGTTPTPAVAKTDDDVPRMLRARAAALADNLALASSLADLADELTTWLSWLDACRDLIDGARDLNRARRLRRLTRLGVVVILLGGAAGAGHWFYRQASARSRIDDIVAQGGCETEAVSSADLAHATPTQLEALRREVERCEAEREEARRAERERALAEKRRQEREAAERRRQQACGELARAFEEADLSKVDDEILGGQRELLQRILTERLTLEDIREDLDLPCADSEAGKDIRGVYARTILATMPKWIQIVVPGATARRALLEHRAALPAGDLALLAGHIDVMAKKAVLSGLEPDVRRFEVLCGLAREVVDTPKSNCEAVMKLAADL